MTSSTIFARPTTSTRTAMSTHPCKPHCRRLLLCPWPHCHGSLCPQPCLPPLCWPPKPSRFCFHSQPRQRCRCRPCALPSQCRLPLPSSSPTRCPAMSCLCLRCPLPCQLRLLAQLRRPCLSPSPSLRPMPCRSLLLSDGHPRLLYQPQCLPVPHCRLRLQSPCRRLCRPTRRFRPVPRHCQPLLPCRYARP